jgi:hypothetical protein
MDCFSIPVSWNELPEGVAGCLKVNGQSAVVELNIDMQATGFESWKWFERTVLGHELGHTALHLPRTYYGQIDMFGDHSASAFSVMLDARAQFLADIRKNQEEARQELQAHRFMGYLLIPEAELYAALDRYTFLDWASVYAMRDEFEVTISALLQRLRQSRIAEVGNGDLIDLRHAPTAINWALKH